MRGNFSEPPPPIFSLPMTSSHFKHVKYFYNVYDQSIFANTEPETDKQAIQRHATMIIYN